MTRRKRDSGGGGNLLPHFYAGIVTLPLIFLVLLLSVYSTDAARPDIMEAFAGDNAVVNDAVVIIGEAEIAPEAINEDALREKASGLSTLHDILKVYIREHDLSGSVDLVRGEDYVFISFSDNMLFEPGSARLRPADIEVLNYVGHAVKFVQKEAEMVLVSGHTADDPNSPVSDRRLSSECADAVLIYLEDEVGIDSCKLVAVAYGKNYPIADNATPEGMSRNRRVEILVGSENALTQRLDTIYEAMAN